jgi:ribonuclease D
MSNFELITTQARLDSFCASAVTQDVLFLDTEFVRTRTLKPKLGLIQAYDGIEAVLVDPLAEIDLTEFWALLTNQAITKVLHSCSEDLEVFKCYANGLPVPLFDTQVAAALLGDGSSLGYAALAQRYLDLYIDKGESRTNWLARPLSDNQLEYAAKDVLYLKPIFEQLRDRLVEKSFYQYVIKEGALAVAKRHVNKPLDEIYLDIKGSWRLSPSELAVLRLLAQWRQSEAQRRDMALPFVLKEVNLITIAMNKPKNLDELRLLPGILPQEVRYHGNTLLKLVDLGKSLSAEKFPKSITRLVDYPDYKQCYKQIKEAVDQAAEQLTMPAEAIASKRQVNQVLSWLWKLDDQTRATAFKPDLLQGWRYEVVGQQLLTSLA